MQHRPTITRTERGLAREVYAMLAAGKQPDEITRTWPLADAAFIKRVRADPVVAAEHDAWRRESAKIRKQQREALANAAQKRHTLASPRVTLCQAVAWLAHGRAWTEKNYHNAKFEHTPAAFKELFETAGHELVDALAESKLPAFGVPEGGSKQMEIPHEVFLARARKINLERWCVEGGGNAFRDVVLARTDLMRCWPVDIEAHDEAETPHTARAEKQCRNWLKQLMTSDTEPQKSKPKYLSEAFGKYGRKLSKRAFSRAWTNAIQETGNKRWSKPGRRREQ